MKCYGACVPLIRKIKVIHHVKEAPILLTLLAQATALSFLQDST